METRQLADYVMKKLINDGADDVVISTARQNHNQIKFVNNSIATTNTWALVNMGIFMAAKKRIVSTSLENFSKESADATIKKLIGFAKKTPEKDEYFGIAHGPFGYKKIEDSYDKKVVNLDDNAADIVEEGIATALANGAERASGAFEYGDTKTSVITSNGVEATSKGTNLYFSIRAFTDKNASGHKTACSRMLKGLDFRESASFAGEISKLAKNPEDIDMGRYDTIFEPLPFSNFLDCVGGSASVFYVEAGLSFLADLLNKKVASPCVTIYDDPVMRNGYGSLPFDAEGVPTARTSIVKNGILKSYLHNTSTAKKYRVKTTANAGLIAPEPWNISLKEGKHKRDELFELVKNGLYITNLWYTRFQNHTTGDFSTIPRDGIFYIKDGEISHPVKDIRISDNMLNIMRNIEVISNKAVQVKGWENEHPVTTPLVLVKNVNITKSKK